MVFATGCVLLASVFGFYYGKYSRIVDERPKKPLFDNTAKSILPRLSFGQGSKTPQRGDGPAKDTLRWFELTNHASEPAPFRA
jgi:hypothetical protein